MDLKEKNKFLYRDELSTSELLLSNNLSSKKLTMRQRLLRVAGISVFAFTVFIIASIGSAGAFFYFNHINPSDWIKQVADLFVGSVPIPAIEVEPSPKDTAAEESTAIIPPTPEAKEQITKAPPKQTTSKAIAGTTKVNSDGSKTVTIAESAVSQSELNRIATSAVAPSTPFDVVIKDETGKNGSIIQPLKEYLNSTLKWSNEITALKEIDIREAGDTGWSGQYAGSYSMNSAGSITGAYGFIILNTSYNQDSNYLLDYMKLVLSHEYGHHYTLYHKWVDGNLPAGTRFPDSYYAVRPLSKSNTSIDCGAGWSSCEPEIIAEDYSYLYSGYGYHAMAGTYGYPSNPGTKDWLNNIVSYMKGEGNPVTQSPPANSPPTVTITSPADGSKIGSQFTFAVTATDDKGVSKVTFSRNDTVLSEDTTAPYAINIDLSVLPAGTYTFKATASDTDGATAEKSFSVQLNRSSSPSSTPTPAPLTTITPPPSEDGSVSVDTIQPSVTFSSPTSPNWDNGSLTITASGADNVGVVKMELYINDTLVGTENASSIARIWRSKGVSPGNYILKIKAYDAAGNIGENSFAVIKS